MMTNKGSTLNNALQKMQEGGMRNGNKELIRENLTEGHTPVFRAAEASFNEAGHPSGHRVTERHTQQGACVFGGRVATPQGLQDVISPSTKYRSRD